MLRSTATASFVQVRRGQPSAPRAHFGRISAH